MLAQQSKILQQGREVDEKLTMLLTAFLLLAACSGKGVSKDQDVSEKEVVEETNAEANEETDSVVDVEPVVELLPLSLR